MGQHYPNPGLTEGKPGPAEGGRNLNTEVGRADIRRRATKWQGVSEGQYGKDPRRGEVPTL